jgi:hypothetical protein
MLTIGGSGPCADMVAALHVEAGDKTDMRRAAAPSGQAAEHTNFLGAGHVEKQMSQRSASWIAALRISIDTASTCVRHSWGRLFRLQSSLQCCGYTADAASRRRGREHVD